MLLPSSIQRAEDLVGSALSAADAGVMAVADSIAAPIAAAAKIRLVITRFSPSIRHAGRPMDDVLRRSAMRPGIVLL